MLAIWIYLIVVTIRKIFIVKGTHMYVSTHTYNHMCVRIVHAILAWIVSLGWILIVITLTFQCLTIVCKCKCVKVYQLRYIAGVLGWLWAEMCVCVGMGGFQNRFTCLHRDLVIRVCVCVRGKLLWIERFVSYVILLNIIVLCLHIFVCMYVYMYRVYM